MPEAENDGPENDGPENDGPENDGPENDGPGLVVEHMSECTDTKAALVVDGSADQIVADLIKAGWTLEERVDYVAGKRIRL